MNYPKCYHLFNGKQNILIIDISVYKKDIVFDQVVSSLFKEKFNLFWFKSMEEMYDDLEEYINYTNDDCYVLIG